MKLLSGIGALLAIAIAVLAGPASAQEDTLTIAVPTDVQNWDAQSTNATAQTLILRQVFDAPLTQDKDLKLIGNVISEWHWVDGLTLAVTLRDDVYFHNGDKLTTEDLRFSYVDRLRNEKDVLQFSGVFNPVIKDIEIVSDTKAVFHLARPMPTLPNWLGFLGQYITPKDYFLKVGREAFMRKPVGSGPYRLVDYQQGARIVLEAFDRYWGGKPAIKNLVFEIIKDPTARVAAISSGRVDIATGVPIREAQRLASDPALVSSIEPTTEILYLNAKREGAYLDRNIRLAAHHAIDKAALSRAFFAGKAPVINAFGVPSMPGYPGDFEIAYDPELSRKLLAESGYSPSKPVKIGFITTNGAFPNDYEVARAIVAMWAQVGIEAELETVDLAKYYELSRGGKLKETALVVYANATNDPELYIGTALNPDSRFSVWKSDDMRDRLAPLFAETDNEKRIAGYTAANVYAMSNGYSMPLLQAVTTVVHKKGINFTWFPNTWYEPYRITRNP